MIYCNNFYFLYTMLLCVLVNSNALYKVRFNALYTLLCICIFFERWQINLIKLKYKL